MFKKFCCLSLSLFSIQALALQWSIYQNFPIPAAGAYGVVGTALPDGRLILWNGDQIFVQNTLDADAFTAIASGYAGDPSFISISPDGHTLLLGSGVGDFSNPPAWKDSLYLFDAQAPADYSAATLALVQPHYDGAFLNDSLVLIDLGKADFSGSELAIVDVSGVAKKLQAVVQKSAKYAWPKDLVVTKPQFSYSSKITVDRANGIVYVMDANTLELRFFNVADLIAAYQSQTTRDWATDGTLVGQAGIYFSNGVCGITPLGSLVVSGSLGYLQPGGIQFLNPNLPDPSLASILDTEDPAGNNPFYAAMYSAGADRVTAFDYVNWYASAASFNDGAHHSADANANGVITLSELMRVIQFFNMGGFSCVVAESSSEDGYFAQGGGVTTCAGHTADYFPHDWRINLSELLRLIQLYQSLGYTVCPQQMTEDGFCPG